MRLFPRRSAGSTSPRNGLQLANRVANYSIISTKLVHYQAHNWCALSESQITARFSATFSAAEANSSVSIFDGGKLIGDVTAAADGTWNFQTNVTGSGVHTYTETSLDSSGFTATSTGVTLYSPSGSQTLQGGSGNDVLIGAPHDILMGNAGSDTFVFNTSLVALAITLATLFLSRMRARQRRNSTPVTPDHHARLRRAPLIVSAAHQRLRLRRLGWHLGA